MTIECPVSSHINSLSCISHHNGHRTISLCHNCGRAFVDRNDTQALSFLDRNLEFTIFISFNPGLHCATFHINGRSIDRVSRFINNNTYNVVVCILCSDRNAQTNQ